MKTVLLIHGFPFDHTLWQHLAGRLQWRALAPDLLGFGAVPGPSSLHDYSMASYARYLVGLLDAEGIDRAVMCGLSMGGYIVFELLRRFPERVGAAIFCNTKAAADTPEARRGRDAMAKLASEGGARAVASALIEKLLAHTTRERRPAVATEVSDMISRQPVVGIVGALRALRERPDSTPLLGRIQVPVLVVAGDDDQITPASGMREMASGIPGARFILIRDAGHVTPLEQPAAVTDALNEFLAAL